MKLRTSFALAALVTLAGCQTNQPTDNDDGQDIADTGSMSADMTIVENVGNANNLSTLSSAIEAGELTELLNREGPITLFAPTDAAFDKLPEGVLDSLLQADNKPQLQQLLACHAVGAIGKSQRLLAGIEQNGGTLPMSTIGGCKYELTTVNGNLVVIDGQDNIINVSEADLDQSNGVIHVVDAIIMP